MSQLKTHARDGVIDYNQKTVIAVCGVRAKASLTVYADSGNHFNCVGCKAVLAERSKDKNSAIPEVAGEPPVERWERSSSDETDNEIIHIMSNLQPDDEVCALYGNADDNIKRAALILAAPELLDALKAAVKCLEWCRGAHKDPQSDSGGIPVELIWKDLIAKAEGHQ